MIDPMTTKVAVIWVVVGGCFIVFLDCSECLEGTDKVEIDNPLRAVTMVPVIIRFRATDGAAAVNVLTVADQVPNARASTSEGILGDD